MKKLFTILMFCSIWFANAQETVIQKKDLPKAAQEFLTKEYANNDWAIGKKDQGSRSLKYKVTLADGAEIEFDKDGQWKEIDGKGTQIGAHFIPNKIAQYVKANYAGQSFTKIDKSDRKIEVKLTNHVELEFTKDGDFVKID